MNKFFATVVGYGLALFGLFIVVYFVFYLLLNSILPLVNIYRAKQWEPTTCVILDATNEVRRTYFSIIDSTLSWRPSPKKYFGFSSRIITKYEYQYADQFYVGNRYSFIPNNSSGNFFDEFHTLFYKKISEAPSTSIFPGTKLICYVNPNDPSESVINRSLGLAYVYVLSPIFYLATFIVLLYFIKKRKLNKTSDATNLANKKPPTSSDLFNKIGNNTMQRTEWEHRTTSIQLILLLLILLTWLMFFMLSK